MKRAGNDSACGHGSWLRHLSVLLVVVGAMVTLSACVTTVEGGRQPASDEKRLGRHLDVARYHLGERNWAMAKPPLDRALQINSRSVEAHVLYGYLYQNEGEMELADASFRQALRIEPGNPQALNNYGSFLFSRKRYQDAARYLKKAAAEPAYEQRAQAYENLGLTLLALDENEDALLAFHRSVNLSNGGQARANLELATIYFDKGELIRADEYYENFRTIARQNQRSLCLGFKLAARRGDMDQAASYGMALKNLYTDAGECLVE